MIRRISVLVLAIALVSGPLAAQQGHLNLRLAQSQPAKFVPPLCNLNLINGKVEKARNALKKAYDVKTPAEKSAQLAEAKMNLLTAISQEAQANNSAAWYYLARVALMEGDPLGADTAFIKAQTLAPSCELDITQYRQNSARALMQTAMEMSQKGASDSALAFFQDASTLYRGWPQIYMNVAVMFANSGREDSSAAYFEKALAVAEQDSMMTEERNITASNLAIMYQRLKRNSEAIALWHKYLSWDLAATAAKRAKVDSLRKTGNAQALEAAKSLEQEITAAESARSESEKDLAIAFRAAGMPDSADVLESKIVGRLAKISVDSLELPDLMSVGVLAFNSKKYSDAEAAFAAGVKRNPFGRDARYNLANTYLALATQAHDSAEALRKLAKTSKNPPAAVNAQLADTTRLDALAAAANSKLIAEAAKLLELEPMSEDNLRLLAQGQRSLGQTDSVIKTATRLIALPFGVEATLFQIKQSGAKFTADATGRDPTDAQGKPLKTAPLTLVFEFVDTNGAVLDSKEVAIPALAPGQKQAIEVEAKGAGIVGWRYRVKPG
jgi:hypothetical protein